MNIRDSELVAGMLLDEGYALADTPDKADVIIFNTCSVRGHAEDRIISNMGQLKRLKKKRPGIILGMMGCTAEYHGGDLFRRLPHLDFICGTANLHMVPELISRVGNKNEKNIRIGGLSNRLPEITPLYRSSKKSAYVSISRGCNNFCAYCIVPHLRGSEKSREPKDIIKEVDDLLKKGYENITLLGQNVNSYGKDLKDSTNFVNLLTSLDKLHNKKYINFLTSHPKDASIELFEAMKRLKGVSKDLHLPLQSGSDRILKLMNRGYDSKYYKSKVRHFKKIIPDHSISTDIIVGFPGETEEDFTATKNMIKEIGFSSSYIFKYSPRPPAPSAKMKDDVPREIKERRHRELLDIQKKLSTKKKPRRMG